MTSMLALPTSHPDPLDAQPANSTDPRGQPTPLAKPEPLGRIADILEAACSFAAPLTVRHVRDANVLRVDLK